MKRNLWICVLFLLGGILSAQLLGADFFEACGYFSDGQLKSFAASSPDRMDLFWNILWKRGKLLLLTALLCATALKRLLPVAARLLASWLTGFFAAVCVLCMGIGGVLFLLAALFPHGICYAAAGIWMYRLHPMYGADGKRKSARLLLSVFGIWTLLLVGCISEALLGTCLLQGILKLIYG